MHDLQIKELISTYGEDKMIMSSEYKKRLQNLTVTEEEQKQIDLENKQPPQMPPFMCCIVTFTNHPGWTTEAYHYGFLGAKTWFVCRTYRPDGSIYDTNMINGIDWDQWLYSDLEKNIINPEIRNVEVTEYLFRD